MDKGSATQAGMAPRAIAEAGRSATPSDAHIPQTTCALFFVEQTKAMVLRI